MIPRSINGRHAPDWEVPRRVLNAPPPPPGPRCPKRCDVTMPPEHEGGDRYVCVCCGTEFRWRPS